MCMYPIYTIVSETWKNTLLNLYHVKIWLWWRFLQVGTKFSGLYIFWKKLKWLYKYAHFKNITAKVFLQYAAPEIISSKIECNIELHRMIPTKATALIWIIFTEYLRNVPRRTVQLDDFSAYSFKISWKLSHRWLNSSIYDASNFSHRKP